MRTRGVLRKIDRCPAAGAVDGLDVLPQLLDLIHLERPDEVLFPQEIDKGDEPPVIPRAAQILEPRVALLIVRDHQMDIAARADGLIRDGRTRSQRLIADDPEQLQHRTRGEFQAFMGVKPEHLARKAEVNGDWRAKVSHQHFLIH